MAREYYGNDYNNVNGGYGNSDSSRDRVAERKQMYRRRKIIRRRIIASIIMILIVALILFIVSLFIRVKEITITGNFGNYTYEEILEASGIEQGDMLLYLSKESVENEIEKALPYTTQVKVKKKLFSKVFIEVECISEAYALYINGEYVVVDSNFKALRFVAKANEKELDIVRVIGLDAQKVTLGEIVKFNGEVRLSHFKKIYEGLQGEPFDKLDYIDVTDVIWLEAGFENGLSIDFGNYTNLDYNLKWASAVVREIESTHGEANGKLNLTVLKKAYYTPLSGDEEPVDVAPQ